MPVEAKTSFLVIVLALEPDVILDPGLARSVADSDLCHAPGFVASSPGDFTFKIRHFPRGAEQSVINITFDKKNLKSNRQ